MFDKKELVEFLVLAKKLTYAAGDSTIKIKEKNGSTTLIFKENNWKYNDNYFGGEPFGGREVVFYKGKPVYIMVYYGTVSKEIVDFNVIYKVLMNALKLVPESNPFRGPQKYSENGMDYINNFVGDIENFSGEEFITGNDFKLLYSTKYTGGIVDQRN